ncbi:MAG: methylenetetrahydrofolate reductase [Oligoflexia bacterium]|nr:methylenetetrahydrofolate reductase [Oligoflexia bacterium]
MTFQEALLAGKKVITAEVTPPHGTDLEHFYKSARLFKPYVHALNVTDNQRALMRMSGLACSALLVREGIEPIYQLTCRDRNILGLQSDILGAKGLGIKNILALTGDPVAAGDTPDAKGVFQVEAVGLLNLINKMNIGTDLNGKELKGKLGLFPGAVVNPGGRAMEPQIRRMEKKIKAGAQFFQTQIVYNRTLMEEFMKKVRPFGTKVLAGILLVRSIKTAQFLHDKVPGIFVPDELFKRLSDAKDPSEEGIKFASELVRDYLDMCDGVHLIAIKNEELIIEVLNRAGIGKLNE